MKASKATRFYVRTDPGEWGPVPWQLLREWLARSWLDPKVMLRPETEAAFSPATQFERLWKIAGRPYVPKNDSSNLASGRIPASPALKRYLQVTLGWPGEVALLNYYDGDKLREALERTFTNPERPLFDDPDWPKCWSWPSPAEAARKETERRAEPVTENQNAVLRFFSQNQGVRTKGEASDLIDKLFSDPLNAERWEQEKTKRQSGEPPSDAQLIRLAFAAKRLGRAVPPGLSKRSASELISEWYDEDVDLEDAYQEFKERQEDELIESELRELEAESARDGVREHRKVKKSGCLGLLVIGVVVIAALIVGANMI